MKLGLPIFTLSHILFVKVHRLQLCLDQVPEAVKKTRVALLNGLSQAGYEAYAKSRIGKPGEILIEKEENGYYTGLTSEYVNGK